MASSSQIHPDDLRDLVRQTFRELGVAEDAINQVRETILIREDHYCGRTFRIAGMLAMWMTEVGVLSFYDEDGELLKTYSLHQPAAASISKAA